MAEAVLPGQHRGTRAVQRMVEFAPSTGGLALWVQHRDLPPDRPGPTIATDGHTVWYGAAFEKLPLAEQTGLVAHEVLHVALRHPQRYLQLRQVLGDVDLQLFNLCADAIVDSTLGHLSWLKLPPTVVPLDRLLKTALDLVQPVEVALLAWDVEQLYRALDDRRPPDGRGRARDPRRPGGQGAATPSAGNGTPTATAALADYERPRREDGPKATRARALAGPANTDLQPGPDTAAAPELEAEAAREWAERLVRAHAGDGAHSMLRTLIADLPRVRTPWEQVLRTQVARSLAPKTTLTWSRPSRSYLANQGRAGPHRRMPFEPGTTPHQAVPRLVLVIDVSGSIEDTLMARFAVEIEALTRRRQSGLVLVIGDDAVRHVQRFEPGRGRVRDIEFQGGGGTDFTPLLEEADRHRPDLIVVLTDLDGPARHRPHGPVLWAVPPAHAHAVAPFGRKLVLS